MLPVRGLSFSCAAVMALLGACAAKTTEAPASSASGRLPCEIERVLAANCRDCHSSPARFGAPMPLATWSDLHGPSRSTPQKSVFEMVGVRTHDDKKPMPEPPRARLGSADQKLLDDWIASGAPEATTSCDGTPREAGVDARVIKDPPPGCPNVTLKPDSPYVMAQSTQDEYVCFGVDVELSKKRHIVSFWPKIQNETIAHHALVYLSTSSVSSVPHPCSSSVVVGRRLVYGWAPGGEPFELPAEAGLPMEGTTHFVVQMHYSNLTALAGQSDQSAIELCTTETLRANDADVMAFGTSSFNIPARKSYGIDCSIDVPAAVPPLTLFRSMPHMHQIGTSIGSSRDRAGAIEVIDEVKTWNFGSQPWNAIDKTIQAGDKVKSWCSWTNGGDSPVSWGEKTNQEMCYHFVMYYPRVPIPGWSWDSPVHLAKCTSRQ